jgi:hypothetical protein
MHTGQILNPSSILLVLGLVLDPDFRCNRILDLVSTGTLSIQNNCQSLLSDLLADYSLFSATYQMHFPFLTCEVECGDGLDVADRHNAYAQSVILRSLYWIYRLVGSEKELHREIIEFSISHNVEDVRIWGHYAH